MVIALWIAGMPGPFSGRTPDDTWRKAYKNFERGRTGQVVNQFDFMIKVQNAGHDVVPTSLGGWILTGAP